MSGSLSSHPHFVLDAFALAPVVAYEPEDVRLGVYTFLPWTRTGLSSIVQNPAAGQIRATVSVSVDVEDDKGGSTPVSKTLTLRGPGDVLGLKPGQIIRRYPAPNTPDAQDTFLAYVEFDRPELPWLFTPFAPSGPAQERLAPWMALVVLEARHASFEPPPATTPPLPPRVRTRMHELQPLVHSWAFAHAQVAGDTGGTPGVSVRADGAPGVGPDTSSPRVRDRLSNDHADVNLSRLICPRRLDDGVDYVACVVPAFDCGVRVAMGLPGGTLAPAWTRTSGDDDQEIVLPVYDHWRFSTAPGGDFEELARRLIPIPAPWKVGRRFIDAHLPRAGVGELEEEDPGRVQILKCALFSAAAAPLDSPPDEAWSTDKREELRTEINGPDAVALTTPTPEQPVPDLPRVGPRIYARFQRGRNRVDAVTDSDWFGQLNTSPVHRIVAGLGTRVVRKDQEPLMEAAWAQVGEIQRANAALVRAQYARYLGASLHTRYLARLSFTAAIQVTRAAQGKLRLGGAALTIRGDLERSYVAPTAADLPFRRAFRPRGALARLTQNVAPDALLEQALLPDGGLRDFREPYVQPDGVTGVREETLDALPRDVVARALGVSERNAIGTLRRRLETFQADAAVADLMTQPVTTWNVDPGILDPRDLGGLRAVDILRSALPPRIARDPGRAEAIGSVLKGLADSDMAAVREPALELETRIRDELPQLSRIPERTGPVIGPVIHPGRETRPLPRPTGLPTSGRIPTVGRLPTSGRLPGISVPSTGVPIERPTLGGPSVFGRPVADAREPLVTPESVALAIELNRLRRTPKMTVATSLAEVVTSTGIFELPDLPELTGPTVTKATLLAQLEPALTVTRYAEGRLAAKPGWLPADWFANGMVWPIMAAPEFRRPMYEALDAYDRDWLVPGLGLIEATDFVTLLQTNAAFTEAFLVGLSDEMGRELLWREYPTDQRGTYFKYFWDDDQEELTDEIHRFSKAPLGHHIVGGSDGRVVFVVRGALVKRYPDAVMFALRDISPANAVEPVFGDPSQDGFEAKVLFHANLSPDILLVGFDLTPQEVASQDWWFFIAEHPTAPRFGLDTEGSPGPSIVDRNDLDWADLPRSHGSVRGGGGFIDPGGSPASPVLTINEQTPDPPPPSVTWPPASSAVLARILLQSPIRAAYEGAGLLQDI
ncbi:MAG TPA: hypothetical protein VK858_17520 [Longimicrobiales bacterium]|nr:hypothetical protein [Longimicrobiales bacterium]